MTNPTYLTFSDQELETYVFQKKKDAVVSFTATWSSESQFIDHHNKRLIQQWPSLFAIKVDVERDHEVFSRFKLTKIPSTLLIKSGKVVFCIPGCPAFDRYREKIIDALQPKRNKESPAGVFTDNPVSDRQEDPRHK